MTEHVSSVEKEHEEIEDRSLYVPVERVQHKFLDALPVLRDVAGDLIAREAYAGSREEAESGTGFIAFDRVTVGGKVATWETLVRLLEESLGKNGDSFMGRPELAIPVAFAAVGADLFADLQDMVRERPEGVPGVGEEQVAQMEAHATKLRELFNISLGMKEFSSFDEESFRSWLRGGIAFIESGPVDGTKEAEDSSRSAKRALLPLFQRFLDGSETTADIDRMLGEIDDKAAAELRDTKLLLIRYSVDKNEECLWQIKNNVRAFAAYRYYDRMLRRKQLGE